MKQLGLQGYQLNTMTLIYIWVEVTPRETLVDAISSEWYNEIVKKLKIQDLTHVNENKVK